MQSIYPEGFMFLHALYALSWCDATQELPSAHFLRTEARDEAIFAYRRMGSSEGLEVFNPTLPLAYGAFYRGWTAYVLGRILMLEPQDSSIRVVFQENCAAIAKAIEATEKPYLESYSELSWPADNVVCLAALALHDRLFEPRYSETRIKWLNRIKSSLLPENQLIPHAYNLKKNKALMGARGSSQALMLAFLPEIDSMFAREQYQRFRSTFLTYCLGLPGIREYPHGLAGTGDIDSGPVVFGIGGAASIVAVRAASLHEDWSVAMGLRNGTSALLLPQHDGVQKRYLFGQLPILDAIIAWSNAAHCSIQTKASPDWRLKFQLFSLLFLSVLIWVIWKTWKTSH